MDSIKAIVLAAGTSSRMGPNVDKIMVNCAGKPLIRWVVDHLLSIDLLKDMIIVANESNIVQLQKILSFTGSSYYSFTLTKPYGTAYSLLSVSEPLKNFQGSILVIDGDLVLIRKRTIEDLIKVQIEKNPVATVLTFWPPEDGQYGSYGNLPWPLHLAATNRETAASSFSPCLVGIMCFQWPTILPILKSLVEENHNQPRVYEVLGRLVSKGYSQDQIEVLFLEDIEEAQSVNTLQDLKTCENVLLNRNHVE